MALVKLRHIEISACSERGERTLGVGIQLPSFGSELPIKPTKDEFLQKSFQRTKIKESNSRLSFKAAFPVNKMMDEFWSRTSGGKKQKNKKRLRFGAEFPANNKNGRVLSSVTRRSDGLA